MRRSWAFQIDGRESGQRLRMKLLSNTTQLKEETIQSHELSHTSTKLTQAQINEMMQVIENIRLKRYKERL